MKLTDVKVRNAKPKGKQYKVFDGDGLFLQVMPNGSKYWRCKYRFADKEKTLALGVYPEISLLGARSSHLEARKTLANGIDPGQQRKAQKQADTDKVNTFEVVAREWYNKFSPPWAPGYSRTVLSRLERDVFPWMGNRPIIEIDAQEVLRTLRRVEGRGATESAHRIKILCGQIFRYAVATGRANRDHTADLKGALPPAEKKHFAAITDPKNLNHS